MTAAIGPDARRQRAGGDRGLGGLRRAVAEPDPRSTAETIAMKTMGAMPRRDAEPPEPGPPAEPRLDRSANRWQGRLPYDEQPRIRRTPRAASSATPTTRSSTGPFPRHMSFEWGDSQRVMRWRSHDAGPRGAHPRQLHRGAARHRLARRANSAAADRRRSVVHRRGRRRRDARAPAAGRRSTCSPSGTAR